MVRAPCCEKVGLKKGPWSTDEDQVLIRYITLHGHGNWRALPKKAGLMRCGKSCRLRWINYLKPDIKRGNFTREEEDIIVNLHQTLGNRWSAIAARLPGRTDNEIKNVWHTHLKKRFNTTKQEIPNKETSSSSSLIINNKINIIKSHTSRDQCHHHHVPVSPQPCSSVTYDMSSNNTNKSLQCKDDVVFGSNTNKWLQCKDDVVFGSNTNTNNELFDVIEPFWSEVLSEAAEPFQLSPISGLGIEEKGGGFVGCGYDDNVMEFWNEGSDRCEDYFGPSNMF